MAKNNPTHPGLSIRYDCLEPLGLTVTAGAKALGVSRKQLSDLVNCKAGLSPEMAIRVAKVFGGDARTWYRLQAAYDIAKAEADWAALEHADKIRLEPLWPPTEREEQAAA